MTLTRAQQKGARLPQLPIGRTVLPLSGWPDQMTVLEVSGMEEAVENREMLSSAEVAGDAEVYEEPQGEMEMVIAQIWRDTFHLDRIGRNDNFFGLGGNSLLGMELTERLAYSTELQIPVVLLFQYPTVRELAEIISAAESD
jgi:hypothetical protein